MFNANIGLQQFVTQKVPFPNIMMDKLQNAILFKP